MRITRRDDRLIDHIFSYGVMAYEVHGRHRPFVELPLVAAVHGRKIAPQRPLETLCPAVLPGLAQLVTKCLSADPGERPTARELVTSIRA